MANEYELILQPRISTVSGDDSKLKSDLNALANKYKLTLGVNIDTKNAEKQADKLNEKMATVSKKSSISLDTKTAIKDIKETSDSLEKLKNQYKELTSVTKELSKLEVKALKLDETTKEFQALNNQITELKDKKNSLILQVDSSGFKELAQDSKEAVAYINAETKATNDLALAMAKISDSEASQGIKDLKEQYKELTNLTNQISGLEIKAVGLDESSDKFQELNKQINELKENKENLKLEVDNNSFNDAVQSTKEATNYINAEKVAADNLALAWASANDAQTKANAQSQQASTKTAQDLDIVISRLEGMRVRWSAMGSDASLTARWDELINRARTYKTVSDGALDPKVVQSLGKEVQLLSNDIVTAGVNQKNFGDRLKETGAKLSAYLTSMISFTAVISGLKNAYQAVKDIDSAMISLRKVTDEVDSTYISFLDGASTKAKELGASVSDVVSATADFSRLGFNLEQSETLSEVATIYTNVGDDVAGISESTSIIVSIMKAFNVEAEESISIIDKLNEVSNRYAVSSGDLGTGLSNMASSLATAGNSLDESLALLTAMTEITQDASESGNSLKVLSMRLRGASTAIEAAGESTDGMAESTSKLQEKILALTNVTGEGGFDIMADSENFKSTYDIMLGISEVWSDMNDIDQAALIELIAGKQRGNSITALLTSMSQAENVLTTSIESSGSAMEEQTKWLEGIEARLQKFSAAWQSTSNSILDSELIKFFIDLGTSVVSFLGIADGAPAQIALITAAIVGLSAALKSTTFENIISGISNFVANIGNIPNSLSQLGEAVNKVDEISKSFDSLSGIELVDQLKSLGSVISELSPKQQSLLLSSTNLNIEQKKLVLSSAGLTSEEIKQALATQSVDTAQKTATVSTISWKSALQGLGLAIKANPITSLVTAITAVVSVVSLYNQYTEKMRQETEEAAQSAAELAQTREEERKSIESQIESYNDLKKSLDEGNLSTDEARSTKEKLLEIQDSLIESYDKEVEGIDLVNGKYEEQIGILDKLSEKKAKDYVSENYSDYAKAVEELEEIRQYSLDIPITSWSNVTPQTEDQKALQDFLENYSELLTAFEETSGIDDSWATSLRIKIDGNAEDAYEAIDSFFYDIQNYINENDINIDIERLKESISELRSSVWTDELENYKKTFEEGLVNVVVADDSLRPLYYDLITAVEEYNNALADGDTTTIEEASLALEDVQSQIQKTIKEVPGVQAAFDAVTDEIDTSSEAVYNFTQQFNNSKILKDFAQELSGLSDIDLKSIFETDGVENEYFNSLIVAAKEFGLVSDETWEELKPLVDLLIEFGYVQGEVAETTTSITSTLDELNEALDNIQSAYSAVSSAIDEYNENGYLSVDTYQSLLELAPEYLSMLTDEEGNLRLTEDALYDVAEARLKELTMKQIDTLIDTVTGMKTEEEQLAYLKGAYDEAAGSIESYIQAKIDALAVDGDISDATLTALKSQLGSIQNMYNSTISGLRSGGLNSSSKSSSSTTDNTKKAAEALVTYQNAVDKANESLAKLDEESSLDNLKQSIEAVTLLLDQMSASLDTIDLELELTGEQDYGKQVELNTQKYSLAIDIGKSLREEFERLAATTPTTTDEASELKSRLEELGDQLRSNITDVREYRNEISSLHLEALSSSADTTITQLSNATAVLERDYLALTQGSLFGDAFTYDFLLPSVPQDAVTKQRTENEKLAAEEQRYQDEIAAIQKTALEKQYAENAATREKEKNQLYLDIQEAYNTYVEKLDELSGKTSSTITSVSNDVSLSANSVVQSASDAVNGVNDALSGLSTNTIDTSNVEQYAQTIKTTLDDLQYSILKWSNWISTPGNFNDGSQVLSQFNSNITTFKETLEIQLERYKQIIINKTTEISSELAVVLGDILLLVEDSVNQLEVLLEGIGKVELAHNHWDNLTDEVREYLESMKISVTEWNSWVEDNINKLNAFMLSDTSWEGLDKQLQSWITNSFGLTKETWEKLVEKYPLVASKLKEKGTGSWAELNTKLISIMNDMMNTCISIVQKTELPAPTFDEDKFTDLGTQMGEVIAEAMSSAVSLSLNSVYYSGAMTYGGGDGSATGNSLIATALSQLGEGNGVNAANKFNNFNAEAWCGDFVDWVASQTGVSIPSQRSTKSGMASMQKLGKYASASEVLQGQYAPGAGDLVYFDWNKDGSPDHVGFVQSVSGDKVYTIEGNTSSGVVEKKTRSLSSGQILGFGKVSGTSTATSANVTATNAQTASATALANYKSSGGVDQWKSLAALALQMESQYSTDNLSRTLYQMKTESSGNPYAINLWDSNAKKGTPSKGLMQVIDPTFKSYARDGFNGNIYDPISNILASIRYATKRYGSLTKAYRGTGYATGGTVQPGEIPFVGDELNGIGGRELGILPTGRVIMLGQSGPELKALPAGTKIINNPDTENILKQTGTGIVGTNVNAFATGTTDYTIQSGDTLSAIAAKFNTTVEKLVELNSIVDRDLIRTGTTIKIAVEDATEEVTATITETNEELQSLLEGYTAYPSTYTDEFIKAYSDYTKARQDNLDYINSIIDTNPIEAARLTAQQKEEDITQTFAMRLDLYRSTATKLEENYSNLLAKFNELVEKGADVDILQQYVDGLQSIQDSMTSLDSEFHTLIESLYSLQKALKQNYLTLLQNQASALTNNSSVYSLYDNQYEQIKILTEIQEYAHMQAEALREAGYDEYSSEIQEQSQLWWSTYQQIVELKSSIANSLINEYTDYISLADSLDWWNNTSYSKLDLLRKKIEKINNLYAEGLLTAQEYYNLYQSTAIEIYDAQKTALDEILSLVQQMIQQQTTEQKEALQDQIDAYKKIVELKKEALQTTAEEEDYDKEVAKKLTEIAKIQAQIAQYDLEIESTGSREAQAEKVKLVEQLAELQTSLADYQASYALDKQLEALDKALEAYEDEKNEEIDTLEDTLSSTQKLYDAAIAYISENWDDLYSQLIDWNANYGSSLTTDIVSVWETAIEAVEKYGSYVDALNNISTEYVKDTGSIVQQMQDNSLAWGVSTDSATRNALHTKNQELAQQLSELTGQEVTYNDGAWYLGNELLYSTSTQDIISAIVSTMKDNSAKWFDVKDDPQAVASLLTEQQLLANRLADYGVNAVKGDDGVWYIDKVGGTKLYDKYHTGGVAGNVWDKRANEVFALLEKSEYILSDTQKEGLFEIVDYFKDLSSKLGATITPFDSSAIASSFDSSLLIPSGLDSSLSSISNVDNSVGIESPINLVINYSGNMDEGDVKKMAEMVKDEISDYTIRRIKSGYSNSGIRKTRII